MAIEIDLSKFNELLQIQKERQLAMKELSESLGTDITFSDDEVIKTVDEMIGMNLVTPQTSSEGKVVRRVYLEKGYNIKN